MRKRLTIQTALLALALATLSSCGTRKNTVTYFQDIDQIAATEWQKSTFAEPKLQRHDQLSIIVNAVDQTAVAAFNKPAYTPFEANSLNMNTQPQIQTYRVDPNGDIDFPVLGRLHVDGMTPIELRDLLEQRISQYASDPQVTVELRNFMVTVMGEVNNPSTSYFSTNRATILEALTRCGDLTVYGDRTNVLMIREDAQGRKEYHRLDLTSAELINSPYYYLKQNDVIYVSPNQARRSSSRYNSMKQQNLSMISTVVSVVSVLSTLAIAIWK